MSRTVIVARAFCGQTLYLADAPRDTEGRAFCWSHDKARAMPLSAGVAARIIQEAQAYAADAYAIDRDGAVIVPAASGAAQPVSDPLQDAADALVDETIADQVLTVAPRPVTVPLMARVGGRGHGPNSDGREG